MREILFRGKRTDNGEWIEGSLIIWQDGSCSIETGKLDTPMLSVIRDSICQFTGLTDKNDKKIWEGDIVRTQPFSDRPYSKRAKFKQHIGVVEHKIYPNYISEWFVSIDDYDGFGCCNWSAFYQCEVIGNIHDNPELTDN